MKPNRPSKSASADCDASYRARYTIAARCGRLPTVLFYLLMIAGTQAAPIIYTFSGNGSGGIFGGASFNDAQFAFDFFADTDNVVPLVLPTHPELTAVMVNCSSSSFTIVGLGSGTFQIPTVVFDNLTLGAAGFSVAVPDGLPSDILDINAPAFFSYGLTHAIGPVGPVDSSYLSFIVPTTLGNLALGSATSVYFHAVVVPEPSATALLLGGCFALAASLLRRRRMSTPPNKITDG